MENKKKTIGFWEKTLSRGTFYSSMVITKEMLDLLKQAEVGGQLTINPNTFEDRGPNSPTMKLGFVAKSVVESRKAKFSESKKQSAESEI